MNYIQRATDWLQQPHTYTNGDHVAIYMGLVMLFLSRAFS